jgi:hypothetical protein
VGGDGRRLGRRSACATLHALIEQFILTPTGAACAHADGTATKDRRKGVGCERVEGGREEPGRGVEGLARRFRQRASLKAEYHGPALFVAPDSAPGQQQQGE